jgi:acetyl-CoA synthetase
MKLAPESIREPSCHVQVGAPDPMKNTSQIVDPDDWLDEVLPNAHLHGCVFNDVRHAVGEVVQSGDDLLRCEPPGVWVREARMGASSRAGSSSEGTHSASSERAPAARAPWIRKQLAGLGVKPLLTDLDAERRRFSWQAVRDELLGPAPQQVNIARLAVDRHIGTAREQRDALRFVAEDGTRRTLSFAALHRATNRFANALAALGLARGDRVFVLAPRCEALYVAVLGALKAGCVVTPLFSAFGPEPIATRARIAEPRLLLTSTSLYRRKVMAQRAALPSLAHVVVFPDDAATAAEPAPAGTLDYASLLAAASDEPPRARTRADDPALLHFTSGTTGTPKGALHVHEAVLMHWASGRTALDLHDQDIYWCTADPGWVTGTSYGIVAPLLHGVTSVVDEGEFDAQRWLATLERERVSVWYTAPTALRMLMKSGVELVRAHRCPELRFIASVGEPLNAEAVWWGLDAFGLPIHDNWWQTETGGIMIANTSGADIQPGSMGRPLPGVDALIVKRSGAAGEHIEIVDAAGVEGELALRTGWPSMFRGYLGQDERYRQCFAKTSAGELYLTGDLARRDSHGYFWFVGRADDVIKSAGHLIGPFEVESALMEHHAVAEAAVIGKPDAVVGEVVKAFVTLKTGFEPSEALRAELLGHARKKLGAAVAPKDIEFSPRLPHTRSGKVMRRLLKARELGLPEGDTSTLEGGL